MCYNGDLRTVGEVRLEGRFPEVTHVMIGRGLVADPGLARKLRGGKGTDREELTDFLAALYQGYTDFYQGQVPTAAQRMREVWFYLIHLFDDAEKLNKSSFAGSALPRNMNGSRQKFWPPVRFGRTFRGSDLSTKLHA